MNKIQLLKKSMEESKNNNDNFKRPLGFCKALFPCEFYHETLCHSESNCEYKMCTFHDGTYVFDECNKDKIIITNIINVLIN